MIPFTLDRVATAVPSMTRLRIVRLIGDAAGLEDIGPGPALLVWIADVLSQDAILDRDQQDLVLQHFRETILDFGTKLWDSLKTYEEGGKPGQLLVSHLIIHDRSHVSVVGCDKILDLTAGRMVEPPLPAAPLRAVSYNLTRLFTIFRGRVWQAETKKPATGERTNAVRNHEGG